MSEFKNSLESLLHELDGVNGVICGDLNVNLDPEVDDAKASDTKNILQSYGYMQRIWEYTRIYKDSKTIIDNIFSNFDVKAADVVRCTISDHFLQRVVVSCDVSIELGANDTKIIRNFKNPYNIALFKNLVSSVDWSSVGKSTIGIKVAKKIGAERMVTPHPALSEWRSKCDGDPFLHILLYFLGNYLSAEEIKLVLRNKPVILDRFWHSTAAFGLAQLHEDYSNILEEAKLPEKGNPVYEWPEDLIKPDKVFLLNVCEEIRIKRISRRTNFTDQENLLKSKEVFRKNILQAYDNMENPSIEKINGNLYANKVVREIMQEIEHLLVK